MKYYLVALLDRNSGKLVDNATRGLVKKIKPKRRTSFYGVVVEIIEDPDMKKLEDVVKDLAKPLRLFKIDVQPNLAMDEETKTIGLAVEHFGYIARLTRNFNTMLELHGFKVRPYAEERDIHLVLYNGGNPKELENLKANFRNPKDLLFKVDRFEIWKNFNFKRDSVVATIPLKDPNIIS